MQRPNTFLRHQLATKINNQYICNIKTEKSVYLTIYISLLIIIIHLFKNELLLFSNSYIKEGRKEGRKEIS